MVQMPMSSRRSSRNGTTVRWIGLHTSEGDGTARSLRDAAWWEGSSHAVSDMTELLDHRSGCVDPTYGAWTLRNGNPKSVNIEQIGYAKWSRDYWLTERMPQLRLTAQWIADMAARFHIPITYIGTQGVRDNRTGVIQHNDYTVGTGDGSHWDCGPGYPIDVVIDLAREAAGQTPTKPTAPAQHPTPTTPEDDMPLTDADVQKVADEIFARKFTRAANTGTTNLRALVENNGYQHDKFIAQLALLSDPAAFAAAVVAAMPAGGDVDQATVEAGVRAVLGTLDGPAA